MKITQKTNVVNQLTVIVLSLSIVFPLPFIWVADKEIAFMTILLLYLCFLIGTVRGFIKLERIRLNDTQLIKQNSLFYADSIEIGDIQYIASRMVYVPTRIGYTHILVGRRVLEFHTAQREYLRIYVDMYETEYIHNVVLEIMRANKQIRWFA